MAHAHERFNPANLERLNAPGRLEDMDPAIIWRALGSPDPEVIIDLGAGTGLFSAAFASLAPRATVYAVDAEPSMVAWMAENRVPEAGPQLVPTLSHELAVPLGDGVAQVLVMMNLHHELADPDALYAEAARLLAPGGGIAVVDWKPGVEGKGPSQEVRVSGEHIARTLESSGFVDAVVHPGFLRHTLVTARR